MYSLKLFGAWQSYWTVMAANAMQLLGYETKTTYDDLKVALSERHQVWILNWI